MFSVKVLFKRIGVFFVAVAVATMAIFVCFNRPVKSSASGLVVGASVIAALSAFMAASGLSLSFSGTESGDLGTMWENITRDFSYDNKALQDWYGDGSAVNFLVGKDNADKTVLVSSALSTWFNELKKWLVNKFSINSNSPTTIVGGNGLDYLGRPFLESTYSSRNIPEGLITSLVPEQVGSYFIQISEDCRFKIEVLSVSSIVTTNVYYWNGSSYVGATTTRYSSGGGIVLSTKVINGLQYLCLSDIDYFSQYDAYRLDSFYTDNTSAYLYNSDHLNHDDISVSGSLTDGYDDFEQALTDAQTDAGTGADARIGINVGDIDVPYPVTSDGIIDGILDKTVDGTITGDLVGGYENEEEAESETDSVVAPSVSDIQKDIVIVDGLEDFFPFCIPFDFIALVEKFNATPEAPVITWNMNFAGIFDEEEIVLDFHPFEAAANIFRICCLVGFIVFLILKTRDLIRG